MHRTLLFQLYNGRGRCSLSEQLSASLPTRLTRSSRVAGRDGLSFLTPY